MIKILKESINFSIILILFFIAACAGSSDYFKEIDTDQAIIISARITAREIGCQVAFAKDPELDRGLRNIYLTAKAGELNQDAIDQLNEIAAIHIGNRPTIIPNVLDLIQLVGVKFDPAGQPIGLDQVSPNLLKAIETGYMGGFDSCNKLTAKGYTESEIMVAERNLRYIIAAGDH